MLTDGFCLLPYCCINAMQVHGHACRHALSADSGHGHSFMPMVDSGRWLGFFARGYRYLDLVSARILPVAISNVDE